jgi:DNA-binding LacI/PurR family transcriptional regulator
VLNRTGRVSERTRGMVMATIRKLRYVPNLHARNLARASSRTLGMIVSDIENPFFPEVIKGFERRAREQGYDVILSDTNYNPALLKPVGHLARANCLASAIQLPLSPTAR